MRTDMPDDDHELKCKRAPDNNMGASIAIGMCLGVALGAAFDNRGVGIALGIAFGAAFGAAFDQMRNNKS